MSEGMSPEDKRKNLASSAGALKVGRRESPDADVDASEEAAVRRKKVISGIIAGAVVVAIVVVVVLVAGSGYKI